MSEQSYRGIRLKLVSQSIQDKILLLPITLIISVILLSAIGIIALNSISNMGFFLKNQLIKFLLGFFLMFVVAFMNIKFWYKASYFIFLASFSLLLLILFRGVEGDLGATRWLNLFGFVFQPSEFVKIGIILMISRYFHDLLPKQRKEILYFIIPLLIILPIAVLIYKQPNLGTCLIVISLGIMMMFLAGVGWKKFLPIIVLLITITVTLYSSGIFKYEKIDQLNNYIKPHQTERIKTFLYPEHDPLGDGYNIIQSRIAIGSGGLTGKGYMQGTQKRLDFVPASRTDFIFSIISEEFGFIGGLIVILLYLIIICYGYLVSFLASSFFAKLLSSGVSTLIFLHVFINIGMVSSILPVVGIPLPLISYGGSSLLSTLIGIGFIMNARLHLYENKMKKE